MQGRKSPVSPPQEISNGSKKRGNALDFWYRLAAQPELPSTASFKERELARKMRSSSIAILTIWIIFFLFIPGCLVLPNHYVIYADSGMIIICPIALFINKKRHPVLAGSLVTFAFELALAAVCLTTWPFDEPSLQQYELFVLGEIMALTLVSPRGMVVVGLCNVVFITLDLIFQPHTRILDDDLKMQFAAILIRPVSLQIMVAAVVSWYAGNQLKTVKQANRAELAAQLEHQQVEQGKQVEREKIALHQQIEQIVFVHAQTMNTHRTTKIPLESSPPVLWPLINVFNSQQSRLQRSWETEAELAKLKRAILWSYEQAMTGYINLDQPTGTLLDSLLTALKTMKRSSGSR